MNTKRILAITALVLSIGSLAAPAAAGPPTDPFPKTLFMDGNGNACGGLFNASGQGHAIYEEHCTPLG